MSTLRAAPRAARPAARAVHRTALGGAPRAPRGGRVPARPRLAPVHATRPDASSPFDDDDDRRYPFIASEFTRVVPAVVGRGARDAARGAGFIVFAEVAPCGGPVDGDASPRALSMDIGGDALLALLLGAARDEEEDEEVEASPPPDVPPLALDLLWSVLQRGRTLSKTAWHLQRVAVVDEKGGAYVARLFFGPPARDGDDARPPPSSWELKCRPSDASWLALQADCPLYIRRDIFDARSVPLDALLRAVDAADDDSDDDGDDGSDDDRAPPPAAAAFEPPPPAVAHVASLAPGDPDGIVLLKRALALAVRDEDFATAARVRDHPAMAAYARAAALDAAGDAAGAAAARREVEDALAGRPTVAQKPTRARRPARGGGGEGRNNNSKGRVRGRKPREQGPEA